MTGIYTGIPTVVIRSREELARWAFLLPTPLFQIVAMDIWERIPKSPRDAAEYMGPMYAAPIIAVAELAVALAREFGRVDKLIDFYRMNFDERFKSNAYRAMDQSMAYALSYDDVSKAATQARWLVEYEERAKGEEPEGHEENTASSL